MSTAVARPRTERKGVVEEWVDAVEEAIISGSVRSGTVLRAIEAHDPQVAREAIRRDLSRSGDLLIRRFDALQSTNEVA